MVRITVIAVAVLMSLALFSGTTSSQERQHDACTAPCAQAEQTCYRTCRTSSNYGACESRCEESADACYNACP